MSKMQNIHADLDKLVKRAAAIKAEALKPKTASIGDDAKDGTKPAATGEQAAANIAASGDRVEAAVVDGSAKDNKANASVENQKSEGVTAVATDGSAGAKGAVLDIAKTEPLTSTDAMKTASDLVAELRKAAANEANASVENHASEGVTAVATDGSAGAKGGEQPVKATEGAQGGKEAEKATDKVEEKTAAAGCADKAPKVAPNKVTEKKVTKVAGIRGFLAQAALSIPQVKTAADAEGMGEEQVGDAAAEDLLQKLESGQVSEEEAQQILQEAIASGAVSEEEVTAALAEAQGGEAAPAGDPAAAGAPAPAADVMAEPKLAAYAVGPQHPQYIQKLAALHSETVQAGYDFAMKLAAELAPEGVEEKTEQAEDKAIGALQQAQEAEKAAEGAEGELVAKTPEEQAALAQAQKELGLSDEDLQALAAAPAPKIASLADKYRVAILTKAAAFKAAK